MSSSGFDVIPVSSSPISPLGSPERKNVESLECLLHPQHAAAPAPGSAIITFDPPS